MKPAVSMIEGLMLRGLVLILCAAGAGAGAAPVAFTPQQQEAAGRIAAKGGLVMQLAADSDGLVVNLSLAGKQAGDAELEQVAALPKVVQLNLANTAVSDAALAKIAGLSELTHLHLEKTAVTDAGLAHLKGLSKLEYLNLYGTAVTDAGLKALSGLKNLKRVYLWQSKVSDAGVAALKQSIPEVYVNRGEELAIAIAPPPADPKDEKKPAAKKPADKTKNDKPGDDKPADAKAAAAAKPINTICPVSGKPVDVSKTLVHDGKVIGFCCENCPKAFAKDPAKYLTSLKADAAPEPAKAAEKKAEPAKPEAKKPEAVKPEKAPAAPEAKPAAPEAKPQAAAAKPAEPVNAKCPVSGEAIAGGFTAVLDGKVIGFCCDKCLVKFAREPQAFAAKVVEKK